MRGGLRPQCSGQRVHALVARRMHEFPAGFLVVARPTSAHLESPAPWTSAFFARTMEAMCRINFVTESARYAWITGCLLGFSATGCVFDSEHRSQAYEGCEANSNCDLSVARGCFQVGMTQIEGKMCSLDCQRDSDCPGWSICATSGQPDASICYKRCATDFDCPWSFECASITRNGSPDGSVCMPRG